MKLLPLDGDFVFDNNVVTFEGGTTAVPPTLVGSGAPDPGPLSKSGTLASNVMLSEGTVKAMFRFAPSEGVVGADVVLMGEENPRIKLAVGMGNRPQGVFAIRQWDDAATQFAGTSLRGQFQFRFATGSLSAFQTERDYHVEMKIAGSRVHMVVDGVPVGSADLPSALGGPLQVGAWCWSRTQVTIANLSATPKQPTAFIVMPFDKAFDAIYRDVVKPICETQFQMNAVRGDEVFGPGVVIKDIIDQVTDAQLIIADISTHKRPDTDHAEHNPNVFFEVGYAMARQKPILLMARRSSEALPFDVSGFRVLFYDDTIAGKAQVEEQLRKHLAAITGKMPAD
jgi:hypothetical protein